MSIMAVWFRLLGVIKMRLLLDLATEPRNPLSNSDAHLQNCFLETDGTTVFITKRPARTLEHTIIDAMGVRGIFYTNNILYYLKDDYTLGLL